MLIVIGPIIEETIHRLWLSFHKTEIIISVTCISFFILGELYHIDDKYIRILTKLAIAFVMGYLFYKIPQARYDSIKSNKYLYRSFIWFSILWFSLMHINNYNVEMYYLPYLIIACLPQFSAGILFTYFRLNLGIYASIFAHILLNGVTYILLQYKNESVFQVLIVFSDRLKHTLFLESVKVHHIPIHILNPLFERFPPSFPMPNNYHLRQFVTAICLLHALK